MIEGSDERAQAIYEARRRGERQADIAARMGISKGRVAQLEQRHAKALKRHLRRAAAISNGERDGWRNIAVVDVELSLRTRNCLRNDDFETMGQIAEALAAR